MVELLPFSLPNIRLVGLASQTRATSFARYVAQARVNPAISELRAPFGVSWGFLPDELSAEQLTDLRSEFVLWGFGNCLSELDHGYARFLDDLWDLCQLERPPSSDFSAPRKGPKKAQSSAEKHKQLLLRCGAYSPDAATWQACLHSLSVTRNCLIHDGGLVRERSLYGNSVLTTRWYRLEIGVQHDDGTITPLNETEQRTELVKAGQGLFAKWSPVEYFFPLGSRLMFNELHIHEVGVFYRFLLESAYRAACRYLATKDWPGIQVDSGPILSMELMASLSTGGINKVATIALHDQVPYVRSDAT
jgi:hypothetical protein